MPKIDHEEYKVLKGLDERAKSIVRQARGWLWVAEQQIMKDNRSWFVADGFDEVLEDDNLFQFIQWEDEEPYSIDELIREYEDESEKTEVKKNIEWLKGEMDSMHRKRDLDRNPDEWFVSKTALLKAIDQLDRMVSMDELNKLKEENHHLKEQLNEQETLSPEWIDENKTTYIRIKDDAYYVPVYKLQNLFVTTLSEIKKVQLSQKTADELNRYKELGYSLKDLLVIAGSKQAQEKIARAWLDGFTIANEEEEQKFYVDLETAAYVAKWDGDGSVQIYTDSVSGSDEYELHLTEQEIKDYDERYWPFAVKVEEPEE